MGGVHYDAMEAGFRTTSSVLCDVEKAAGRDDCLRKRKTHPQKAKTIFSNSAEESGRTFFPSKE